MSLNHIISGGVPPLLDISVNNLTANNVFLTSADLISANIGSLTCTDANITTMSVGSMTSSNADIDTLTSLTSDINNLTSTTANITNGNIGSLNATSATLTTLISTDGTINNLTSTSGTIGSLTSINATVTNMSLMNGTIASLTTMNATIGSLSSMNLTAMNGTISSLMVTNETVGSLTTTNLTATSGTIPTLTSTDISTTTLTFPSGGNEVLDYYDEDINSTTYSGIWASTQNNNIYLTRIGRIVNLVLVGFTSLASIANFITSSPIPSQYRPSIDIVGIIPIVTNSNNEQGQIIIASTGVITIFRDSGTNFQATNQGGFRNSTITYAIT